MIVQVKITVGAKKRGIKQEKDGVYSVCVKSLPEQGKANKELLEVVAEHFKKPLQSVKIVNGHKRTKKLLRLS